MNWLVVILVGLAVVAGLGWAVWIEGRDDPKDKP